MRKYLSIFLLLLATQAQAAGLVDTLSERAQNIDSISGQFEQARHIAALNHPLVSKGDFSYSRTEGLTWNNRFPFQNSITITPQQDLKLTDQNGNSSQIPTSPFMARIFLGLLLGDFSGLTDVFTIAEDSVGEDWKLTLTPTLTTLNNGLNTISISGDKTINNIVLHYQNQDQTTIKLSQQRVTP